MSFAVISASHFVGPGPTASSAARSLVWRTYFPELLCLFTAAAADLSKHRCETTTGTSVHRDVALRALITGRVRRVVVDADSVVIDLGRTQRLFTGKARQAAQLLATTCTHRGCDIPATLCDVDHRNEWADDGGPTDQANAMPLCGSHDRWKHANKIRSRRATSGQLFLITPDGTTILPTGAHQPEWAEPPPTKQMFDGQSHTSTWAGVAPPLR